MAVLTNVSDLVFIFNPVKKYLHHPLKKLVLYEKDLSANTVVILASILRYDDGIDKTHLAQKVEMPIDNFISKGSTKF